MAISAIYQHHERTTTANLEADLQLREIGIDPVQKFLTAYSEVLGTKLRGVTQESPAVLFVGTLGATGDFAINTNKFMVTAASGNTVVAGTLDVTGAATTTGVHTFTAAPVFSSATASQAVFTNGSKSLVSNAITGTGNVVMSASPTFTGTISGAAMTLSGLATVQSLKISAISTQYVIPFSTDAVGNMGVSASLTFNSATSTLATVNGTYSGTLAVTSTLAVTGATTLNAQTTILGPASTTSRPLILKTGAAVGANNDYVDMIFRGLNTVSGVIDGGSIRCTFTDVTTRNAKIGIYGSAAEVQTLGIEVASNGAVTMPVTLAVTGLTTMAAATATTAGGAVATKFGSSAVTGIYFGSGAPTITAPQGALYLRTDGSSTSTRAYINTTGSTTWTAITTAA